MLRVVPLRLVKSLPPQPNKPIGPWFDDQVQLGLNLMLRLKSPAQMPALLQLVQERKPKIQAALSALHYVHFARFLPTPDYGTLQVITTYDGVGDQNESDNYDFRSYLMDFVGVLHDEFTAMLEFVADAPPLPVKDYPLEFIDFVTSHNMPVQPWSAYPHMTVIGIQNARTVR